MDNPYAAGQADPGAAAGSQSLITPRVHNALGRTRPWVRLLAVLGFISSGLMLLGGVFMLIGGGLIAAAGASGGSGHGLPVQLTGGLPMVIIAVVYIGMGVLYLFPSLMLWNYGGRIASMERTRAVGDLEGALEQQASFWRFVGILALVMIALYLVLIVVMVVAAGVGAAMAH